MSETKKTQMPYVFSDGEICSKPEWSEILWFLADNEIENSIVFTQDELGIALLFYALQGEKWCYCEETGVWYRWEKENWKACRADDEIRAELADLIAVMKLYCADRKKQGEKMTSFASFLRSVSTAQKLRSVTNLVALRCRITAKMLDSHPYIINTPLKAYNLKKRGVVPDEEKKPLHLTFSTAAIPAGAKVACPEWDNFIDEIMSGNEEKKAFLQRALGYSLLGDNREECMFIAYGPKTRNGKGTLFSAVMNAVGREYMCAAPADLICGGNRPVDVNAPSPLLAGYTGKRILSMSESNREIRLNSALIKTLTGRDEITARGLYGKPFTYVPQFTIWLSTNHLPEIDDPGIFASERIRVIEFCEHFGEDRQNKDLKNIFSTPAAAAYIMSWLMKGAIDYIVNGLQVPDCVREATLNYQKRSDTIGRFIEERCHTAADKRVLRPFLYRAYRSWCATDDCNTVPLSAKALCTELENRGCKLKRIHGESYLFGIDLMISDTEYNMN